MLREVSHGLAAATGEDFFRSLVGQLTRALGVEYAFVAERLSPDTARAVALCSGGHVLEGISYPLAGAPCQDLLAGRPCTHPAGVRTTYPHDRMLEELGVESYLGTLLRGTDGEVLGWLAVMDRRPLADPCLAEAVVQLFAFRAAAELDRRRVEVTLRRAHDELQRRVTERTRALQLSEEKFAKAFRASPNALTISCAAEGRFLEVNDTFLRWHGLRREDVIGRTSLELGLWADPEERAQVLARLAAEGAVRQYEFWFRVRSGERRLGLLSAERLDIAGERCLLVEVSDLTEHRRAEEALREGEARHQAILDNATNVVWVKDPAGRHLLVNRRFEQLFNLPRETVMGRRDEDLFSAELALVYRVSDEQVLRTGQRVEFESTSAHDDGVHAYLVQKFPLRDAAGRPVAVCGIATDITARKRAEERLLHDAFHDALTGLPNRALFMDRLGRAVERGRRHPDRLFAVLFCDLDRFKLVNDGLGHAAGDELLIAAARAIELCLRPEDTVARLGGDEFAVLLDAVDDPHDATRVAERIQRALTHPVLLAHQEVFPSASIGIALSTTGYTRAADVLRDADTAMYRAKAAGRARAEVFDTAMHAQAVALLRLETDLRQAVERREFALHYQPIVAAGDGRILGAEALLRWRHPTRGLLLPADFLDAAEDTGLIVPIGHWVLAEACRQLRAWQERVPSTPPLLVSVNLGGRQFLEEGLVERVAQVLAETGIAPRSLMLEITERVLMDAGGAVVRTLARLRDLQVRVSIDDFGTGYSSLSYLHRFPIDVLKIDRSFVGGVHCGQDGLEIVRTIITLAHTLDKDVIAEGVETADQLACLRALGCDYVQGFHLSRASDGEALAPFLAARSG